MSNVTDEHNTVSTLLELKFILDLKKKIILQKLLCFEFGVALDWLSAITDLMLNRQDAFREGVKKVIILRT